MNYKAIGFDYGGVIGKHISVMPAISEAISMPLDELKGVYFKYNQLSNVGGLSYEDLWEKILTELGKVNHVQKVRDILSVNNIIDNDSRVLELIQRLKARGFKTGLLSNNTKEVGDKLRDEGLDKYFDSFIISAEVGCQKPDAEIFNILFTQLGVTSEQCIFIDDSEQSLRFSDEIGYTPILFKDYDQLVTKLTELKVL